MTATVDLIVLAQSNILSERYGIPCYDTRFILTYFIDSSGTYHNPHCDKGVFLDTLFGNGPKRYGLKTYKKVTYVKAPPRRKVGTTYSVFRNEFLGNMEVSQREKRKHRKEMRKEFPYVPPKLPEGALSIEEFLSVLSQFADNSEVWSLHNSRPMYGFLRELGGESFLVMPIIGIGLSREFPEYFGGRLGASTIIGFWGIP